uniref:CX domain-containing protein n=1 Tax=Steinernema glaseri TaxID=37863 RepID=A0A1I7ZI55_9BILA
MSPEDGFFLLSLVVSFLVERVATEQPQIGFYPMKGNMWRAKHITEISVSFSDEFRHFISKNVSVMYSMATNQSYFYSNQGLRYPFYKDDPTVCEHEFGYQAVSDMIGQPHEVFPNGIPLKGITVYFLCDDHCCADECCQRDIPVILLGIGLIILSIFIIVAYLSIYLAGLLVALWNGRLCGKPQDRYSFQATPSKSTSASIGRHRGDF